MKSVLTCHLCGRFFEKENGEINRRLKNGFNQFYCSLSCGAIGNNRKPERRLLNIEIAKQNFRSAITDPEVMSKAHLGSQYWKYAEVDAFLKRMGIHYQFEFPLTDINGKIYLYDLCFYLNGTIVEFDGPGHRTDRRYCESVDKAKNELANSQCWTIVRIPVQPNSVIPSSAIRDIFDYL